jgi:hypothetical protein
VKAPDPTFHTEAGAAWLNDLAWNSATHSL